MIRKEIEKLIKKSIEKLQKRKVYFDFLIPQIMIEHPKGEVHGDYSTNVAMMLAQQINKNPSEIAENLKSEILNLKSKLFEKIEVASPGFLNFFLSKNFFQDSLRMVLEKKEKFGRINFGNNKKVQVEFISANPTGPLTVGNARGGAFGDVLANVLEMAGFKTEKAYYINDYGNQILTLGHSVLKDNQARYKGKYIDDLAKKIKEKKPYQAGEKAAKIILREMIKKTTERMGIKFNEWFSESRLHKSGDVDKTLEILKKKGLIYEKDEALWFKSTKFGDIRDRVVVKKDGQKTYLAGDIAYHRYKFEKKKFDKVINIWGADHAGDVAGLQAGVEAFGHKGKLEIILLQFVTVFEKGKKLKMSKRTGVYITIDELLNEIPLDVVRFFFLQRSANTHLNFDLDLAREQSEKNPVYYIQYAHARICSILQQKKLNHLKKLAVFKKAEILNLLNHQSELELIKQIVRFPEIIEDTAKDYQIQRIPQYAFDTATAFHKFYRDCRVLTENLSLLKARLALVLATKIVLKNVLSLMGISAPERM